MKKRSTLHSIPRQYSDLYTPQNVNSKNLSFMKKLFTLYGVLPGSLKKLTLLLGLIIVVSSAHAATKTATAATGNWSAGGTWAGGVAPVANDDIIINAGVSVTINAAPGTMASVTFAGTTNATITINSGFSLTVSGITTLVTGTSTTASTIAGAGTLNLGSGGSIAVTDAGTGTNGATISSLVSLGNAVRTINVANSSASDDLTISGVISQSAAGGGISKTGAGQLRLSGANTYAGGTALSAGTINITNAASLGTGTLTATNNALLTSTGQVTLTIAIALTGGGGGMTLAGNIYLHGAISGGGGLVSAGENVLGRASGNNAIGPITISGGRLHVGVTGGANNNINGSAITINNGTTLDIGYAGPSTLPNILNMNSGAILSNRGAGTLTVNTAGSTFPTTGSLIFNSDDASTNPITLSGTYPALTGNLDIQVGPTGSTTVGTVTLGGLSGGSSLNTLNKTSTGILILNGTNTYTSATNVIGGILRAGSTTAFGNGSAVTLSNTAGVTLDLNGNSNTIGSLAGVVTGTNGNVTLGAGTLTIGSNNTTTSYSGVISGAGGITKTGTGTLTLSGVNTYTGATAVNDGTLKAGVVTSAFGNGSNVTLTNAGSVLDITGFNTTIGSLAGTGANNVILGAATLTTGNTSTTSYAGAIGGTGAVIKNGTGAWTLSGTNTYSGTTTINSGTVFVNGSTASSAVSVASATTLAGSGTAAGTVALSGIVAPGATAGTVGTLTTGDFTFNTSTQYTFDITNVAGTEGAQWDLLTSTGTITINATSGSPVTIRLTGTPAGFSQCSNYTWKIAGGASIASFAANKFTVNTASFTPTFTGTFSVTNTGNDLNLVYTAPADMTVSAASYSPTLCISTALSPTITHSTTGATGINQSGVSGANGLPAGVSATWAANTITISGTPSVSGTFNYSIPLTGGCGTANATGTISVTPNRTAGAASSSPTLCVNTPLSPDITHTTTNATGINQDGVSGANGLPAGVSATYTTNLITISGTPTVSGVFNYSIPLIGCGTANATGTITVNSVPTISTQPTNQTACTFPGTASFSVVAGAGTGTLSYQWRLNGVNLVNGVQGNGTNVSGAGAATLNVSAITNANAVSAANGYDVVITRGVCLTTVTSTRVALAVNTSPNVSNFSTSATSPILVGTASTVTISSTSLGAGSYTVTYNRSAPNAATGLTAGVTLSPTSGSFSTGTLASVGSTTITITSISNGTCSNTPSSGNTAIVVTGPATGSITYNASSTFTPSVCSITVQAWGGGGAGGGTTAGTSGTNARAGAGGGGGAFASATLSSLTPGAPLTVTVAPSVAGVLPGSGNGPNGNFSTIVGHEGTIYAAGGTGGTANTAGGSPTGGAGGVNTAPTQGTTKIAGTAGGAGASGTGINSGAGGAGANSGGAGGGSVGSGTAAGNTGTAPGGGGGGARSSTTSGGNQIGGTGAAGRIIISFSCPFATISYSSSTFCTSITSAPVTITGTGCGIFSYTGSGTLSLSTTTGLINPSLSTTGTYIVHYKSSADLGGCAAMDATATVTIDPGPVVSSPQNLTAVCSGDPFSFTPSGVPAGTKYTWTAATGTNISGGSVNPSNPAGDDPPITQTLSNSGTVQNTATFSATPISGSCSGAPFTVNIPINPLPSVGDKTASVCGSGVFTVTPGDAPVGTTYIWGDPDISPNPGDITGAGAEFSPQSSISQNLTNTGTQIQTVTYTVFPVTGDCSGAPFLVTVTVNPTPVLTSPLSNGSQCSGNFSYTPTSAVENGATFSWTRAAVTGISQPAAGPTAGGVNETLTNTTNIPVLVTYAYTLTANGCNNVQNVTVTINPSNQVSSATPTDATVCPSGTTSITANGVGGTATTLTWWTGSGGTGSNLGNSNPLTGVGPGTYYARVTGTCGVPAEASATVGITTYTITASAGPGGTISNPGPTVVNCESTPSYTITPNAGFVIDDVLVDGSSVGSGSIYNFTSVTANHTIAASFINTGSADYRSFTSGNFSNPANWEYYNGSTWVNPALSAPGSGNNVNIRNGHNMVQDMDFTVGSGKTLLMDATSSLTVNPGKTLVVTGTANLNSQLVVFKSDAGGTGTLGNSSGTINGKDNVTIERYLPAAAVATGRSWRLLTIPVLSGSKTIRDAWAGHAANPNAPAGEVGGSGTQISGYGYTDGPTAAGAGYDWWPAISGSASSIRNYTISGSNGAWTQTPSTGTLLNSADQGYMLFVRGDRTVTTGSGNTTLRPNGTLKSGQQTYSIPAPGTAAYKVIGNPYPATISYESLIANGSNNTLARDNRFWQWDANMGTNGGYRLINKLGAGNWIRVPALFTDPSPSHSEYIESSQAFIVETLAPGNLAIEESNKQAPLVAPPSVFDASSAGRFYANLNIDNGSSLTLSDGVLASFDNGGNNGIDGSDVSKIDNFNENLGLLRNGKHLTLESRDLINLKDTLYLGMSNLVAGKYAFQFKGVQMQAGLKATLQDLYEEKETPVSTTGDIVTVKFTVSSDASSAAPDRFRIVFKGDPSLPLAITSAKAYQQNGGIEVEWNTANEQGIRSYEVEKSTDGSSFSKTTTVMAKGQVSNSYGWFDATINSGKNYYRIRIVSTDGSVSYSQVLVVNTGAGKGIFALYPNPVKGSEVTLQLSNMEKGKYALLVYNNAGAKVLAKEIVHLGGSATEELKLGSALAGGVYRVSLVNSKGSTLNQTLVVQR